MNNSSQASLNIGIVGAGVAGLSAAIALRRAGHSCEIWERSMFRNETGAAVSIPPNGGRVLKKWGFDSIKAEGVQIKQVRRPKGDTLEPMAPTIDFSNIPEKYGNEWFFYHRADMHQQLRELAIDTSLDGTPSTIHLGQQVVDIDPEEGRITLKDGIQHQKDLIIIADGQHDLLNEKITGVSIAMQRSGQTAYRCLIPMETILADPETAQFFENQAPGFWAPALPQKGVMAVTYPCHNNTVLNCLIVARKLATQNLNAEDEANISDWNHPATAEELSSVLDGFHPAIKTLMLKSPVEIKSYTQMKRDPLPKMFRGKAILIGDACHPMLLTHAQGVSSSIEDAAALETFLSSLPNTDASTLQSRLELFEALRLPRVSATQIMTEPIIPGPKFAENAKAAEDRIRRYYQGELPPMTSVPHSQPICDFFFGYDVSKDAQRILAEHVAAKEAQGESDTPAQAISHVAKDSVAVEERSVSSGSSLQQAPKGKGAEENQKTVKQVSSWAGGLRKAFGGCLGR